MLKRQACAKFQSQIFDESEVIQILKIVRWHFCQVAYGIKLFTKFTDLRVSKIPQGTMVNSL